MLSCGCCCLGFVNVPFPFLDFCLDVKDYVRSPFARLRAKVLDTVRFIVVDTTIVEHKGDVLANVEQGLVAEQRPPLYPRRVTADKRPNGAHAANGEAAVVFIASVADKLASLDCLGKCRAEARDLVSKWGVVGDDVVSSVKLKCDRHLDEGATFLSGLLKSGGGF